MPATGTHAPPAHLRGLRLLAAMLVLLFLASLGAVWASPAAAKDWTPQIQATRRAQVYWESVMRAADSDVRSLKKAHKQTQRKLKSTQQNLRQAAARRGELKHKLADTRSDLVAAKAALAATPTEPPPPPDAATAMLALQEPTSEAEPGAGIAAFFGEPDRAFLNNGIPSGALTRAELEVTVGDVTQLQKQLKKQKRAFKKARKKARRISRNVRTGRSRLASVKAAQRNAFSRRESAERNLGAWIIAMSKYGRIRATKKSKTRPGYSASFVWPARGSLSQRYHAGHDGLDIASYRGAPIRAAAYGVITYVGWNPWDEHGRAFMVVVTHAGRYETLYGHMLPRRGVRVGQEVSKGEVIGYMGSTGNSTGNHLHFELRRGRTTINPLPFL